MTSLQSKLLKEKKGKVTPPTRFVLVGGGPVLGGKGVKVTVRELFTDKVTVIAWKKFQQLKNNGQIEQPARIEPKTLRNAPAKPYVM